MRELRYRLDAYWLPRLHQEIAALPGLEPRATASGDLESVYVLRVEDGEIVLEVPDDADIAAIDAVIAAHDPTPPAPVPAPDEALRAAVQDIRTRAGTAATVADLQGLLIELCDVLTGDAPAVPARAAARAKLTG